MLANDLRLNFHRQASKTRKLGFTGSKHTIVVDHEPIREPASLNDMLRPLVGTDLDMQPRSCALHGNDKDATVSGRDDIRKRLKIVEKPRLQKKSPQQWSFDKTLGFLYRFVRKPHVYYV